jgi:hypothetical protein
MNCNLQRALLQLMFGSYVSLEWGHHAGRSLGMHEQTIREHRDRQRALIAADTDCGPFSNSRRRLRIGRQLGRRVDRQRHAMARVVDGL